MKKHARTLGKLFIICFAAGVLAVLLCGCGSRTVGYGVILWSDNEGLLPTGTVVPVKEQSRISNTYTIAPPVVGTNDSKPPKKIDIAQWRVSFFNDKKAADAFRKTFKPYVGVYARSDRNALPIRSEANPNADMVYKLRQGEIMKVLKKSDQPSNEAGRESYWYKVLTKAGVSGWVFGYLLSVYDQGTGGLAGLPQPDIDPVLANIESTDWRPSYFVQMINSGMYDLSRFKPEYGFFPDPQNKRFKLVLPEYSIAFDYTGIQRVDFNRYTVEGTSLLITVRSDTELSLQYSYKGKITSAVVEKLDTKIEDIIKAEQKRRDDLYTTFLDHGNILSSNAYGEIRLGAGKSFTWTDFQPLVPNVIPRTATGSGAVAFPLYLNDSLKQSFDGVITFDMNGTDNTQDASFLYAFAAGGVRFTYVPPRDIKENVVQRESFSPLIIFFSLKKSGS